MKANELRIGNFVTVNNPEFRPDLKDIAFEVKAIHESFSRNSYEYGVGLKHINMISNKYYEYPSQLIRYINPIKLTEDWLLKFGFESDQDENEETYANKVEPLLRIAFNDFTEEPYHIWDSANTGSPCKYIHQLQNLYFALIGKELAFNQLP